MTSHFLLVLLVPKISFSRLPGRLWLEGFIGNRALVVLFGGCDTSLVDPGGSFMCVADDGMLHKLRELLGSPEVDRTKL